VTGKER